ncbi:MAG: hypothetical protein IKB70_08195 [Bacilli bacterium]|nr:hypothetical protein [Bacilli bacterium]
MIKIDETRLTNSALYMIGIELGLRKADDEQFIDFVKRVKETFKDDTIESNMATSEGEGNGNEEICGISEAESADDESEGNMD